MVVRGDVTGTVSGKGYLSGVITGRLRGTLAVTGDSYCAWYILGGFDGVIELPDIARAKVYLAGTTPEEALDRIKGGGTVFLESSSLPAGTHERGKLHIVVVRSTMKADPLAGDTGRAASSPP